jgi:Cu(I)/Ag(I) efflux system membrane fusion protein
MDTRKGVLSAPAMGRVDRWWVESVGTEVTNGQPLLAFFSPSWSSRRLYLQGRTATPRNSGAEGGSNPGLTVHGGPEPEGRSRANAEFLLDLVAPQAGVLLDRSVLKGQYVQEGDPLLTLADPSMVWFRFEVTDAQAGWLEVGSRGELSVPNEPGPSVPMVVEFVEPVVQAASRTARARATLDNPWVVRNGLRRRSYRFGQYAEARLHVTGPMVRVVPRDAVMFSAASPYVFVARGSGVFQKHHIRLGRSGDAVWEVLAGVELGDQVVSSGNVLVDAQSQLYQSGDAVPIEGKALAADRWCASGPMGPEMSALDDNRTSAVDRRVEGVLPLSRNEQISMEVSEPASVSQASRPSGIDRSRLWLPSGRKVSRD